MEELQNYDKFILHIFPREKFTDEYIRFINSEFDKKNHVFLIYGKVYKTIIDSETNVISFHNRLRDIYYLLKLANKCKGIIMHSFTNSQIISLLFLQPWLLQKLNICFWGSDLYYYRDEKKKLKQKIFESIRRIVIKNSKYITTLVEEDYKLAQKWYNVKGEYLEGIYMNLKSFKNLIDIREVAIEKKKNKEKVKIQIGNNGQKSNNHMEAINMISKFANENIEVYVPLSYGGEKEYVDKIIKYGKENLGDKFIPIVDFMSVEDYNDHLSNIHIGIFCNDRQQGMGNIHSLVYLGSKVFINNKTSMWNHFCEKLNYKLYSIYDINDMNYDEFIRIDIKEIENNATKVEKYRSNKHSFEIWNNIFYSMNLY